MKPDQQAAEWLFEAARQLPNADQRAAFLQIACGEDFQLRQRVEALLQANEQAQTDEFLGEPHAAVSTNTCAVTTGMGPVSEKAGDGMAVTNCLGKSAKVASANTSNSVNSITITPPVGNLFFRLYHPYLQLALVTFTREVLELEPAARDRALAKIRRLERSFLAPLKNLRPP